MSKLSQKQQEQQQHKVLIETKGLTLDVSKYYTDDERRALHEKRELLKPELSIYDLEALMHKHHQNTTGKMDRVFVCLALTGVVLLIILYQMTQIYC